VRVLVIGGPKVGKTTLADKLGAHRGWPVRHTDDLIGKLDWSAASEEVSRWMDEPGPYVIEGVSVVRAVRKWLDRHHRSEVPCDQVYFSRTPRIQLVLPGHLSMTKGVLTVWAQVQGELERRGVKIDTF
jgi:adenylate kinase family enzyme